METCVDRWESHGVELIAERKTTDILTISCQSNNMGNYLETIVPYLFVNQSINLGIFKQYFCESINLGMSNS